MRVVQQVHRLLNFTPFNLTQHWLASTTMHELIAVKLWVICVIHLFLTSIERGGKTSLNLMIGLINIFILKVKSTALKFIIATNTSGVKHSERPDECVTIRISVWRRTIAIRTNFCAVSIPWTKYLFNSTNWWTSCSRDSTFFLTN